VLDQGIGDAGAVFAQRQPEDCGEPGGPLHQRGCGGLAGPADDQIALPMPRDFPVGHLGRPVMDRTHPHDRASLTLAHRFTWPSTDTFGLQHDPVPGQLSLGQRIDVGVHRFMTHPLTMRPRRPERHRQSRISGLGRQPPRDRLRRPAPLQVRAHPRGQHLASGDLAQLRAGPTPLSLAVGVHQPIPAGLGRVATYLSRDHRLVPTQVCRDRGDRPPRLQPRRDLHPISHRHHPPRPSHEPTLPAAHRQDPSDPPLLRRYDPAR
jgi:hypothetical protein